jgi:hypothetical protein
LEAAGPAYGALAATKLRALGAMEQEPAKALSANKEHWRFAALQFVCASGLMATGGAPCSKKYY